MQGILARYIDLKNPVEAAAARNIERVVIRSVDCRSLGALGMPALEFLIIESDSEMYGLR